MKLKKLVTITIFLLIISIGVISNAGLEIKSGTSPYTNVNISESFNICYNLRDGTSTLGTCSLDPHMATSLDWGAVMYLAQSRYGVNSSSLTSNTTGNKSGAMDFGNYTQTATMFESRSTTSTEAKTFRYRLEEALADDNLKKYVDIIPNTVNATTTRGRAIGETPNWYGATYTFNNSSNTNYPIIIRDSEFGVFSYYGNYVNGGQALSNLSFRPVIWN